MFAAVSFIKAEGGRFNKLFHGRFSPPSTRVYIADNDAIRFYVIEAKLDEWDLPDWNDILSAAQEKGIRNLLLPAEAHPPEIIKAFQCSSDDYRKHYVLRISREAARASGLAPRFIKTAVIDLAGRGVEEIPVKTFLFSSDVTVLTDEKSKYESLCRHLSDELGLRLNVTDDREILSECNLMMAPYGVSGQLARIKHSGLLVSGRPVPYSWEGSVIDSFEPELPASISGLCPKGIRLLDYASALWKYNGLSPIGRLAVSKYLNRGSSVVLKDMVTILDS